MVHVCTIIAGNYLAAARVLAASFFAKHPDSSFAVLVVDDERRAIAPTDELDRRIDWWRLADLGLDEAAIHCLAGIYEVSELSTSVKPLFLRCLLRARGAAVIYLDPDIQVFGSLDYVARLAEQHGVVLTPHVTQPIPEDGRQIDALFVLAAGVYNLGFAAVGPSAGPCLDWWWQQTRRRALNDVREQMFTDQRWADYMPSLFSHHLLKDPAYNAAYWNLHERPLSRTHGRVYARREPLRFFHFSGFDPRTPWLLSKHQGERPRHLLSEQPVLAALCDDYAAALGRAGFAAASQRRYGWEASADGLAMTHRVRRIYWAGVMAAEREGTALPPDPFDDGRPQAFTAWLNTPDERLSRRWSRYLRGIYDARPDVRAHMPAIDGADAAKFANWLRSDGVVQEHIPSSLTPPAPAAHGGDGTLGDNGIATPLPEGLNVCGYFRAELGVGEAARLLIRAIEATGSDYVTSAQLAPRSRQQHRFETRDSDGTAPFDVNLLCVNADATPGFAREAGPAFFAGRHTIGYWFWEVDPLPDAMHGAFDLVEEVWAATDYVAGILRAAAAGRRPVFTVPLPLPAPPQRSSFSRAQLGLPADRFVFLFAFDFLSVMERKNPLGAIEAFCSAFAPGEGPVLVLKSINGEACMPQLERLRRAAAHRTDIVIRDGYVSAEEKNALVAACDCYVSLHRAEGLGLTLAEAMAMGKPAIATGYSGNRHFMTDDNSFLVEYQLINAGGDCGPYPPNARWAEPDLAHAVLLMQTVYQHPSEAARRAERGRTDLLLRHGVLASAAAISQRLDEIRRGRTATTAVPSTPAIGPEVAPPLAAPPPEADVAPAIAPQAAEVVPPADADLRAAAVATSEAFAGALPYLHQLKQPHLTHDGRRWQGLRHAAQRLVFRVIRPYWFQQRQFQDALLETLRGNFERLAAAAAAASPLIALPAPPAIGAAAPPARTGDTAPLAPAAVEDTPSALRASPEAPALPPAPDPPEPQPSETAAQAAS